MKKLILTIVFCVASSCALLAQGTVAFQNFVGNVGGRVYIGNGLAPAGSYHIELLAGPIGSFAVGDLTSRRVFLPTTGGGQFFDGSPVILTNIPAGFGSSDPNQNVVLALRGWTGNYADYASAYAASLSGLSSVGVTAPFTNPTGNGGTPPSTPANMVGWLAGNSLVLAPEPGTIMIGGLGIAALLLIRRGKRF